MTMRQLRIVVNDLIHEGRAEDNILEELHSLLNTDKINREQFNYSTRRVNLYFRIKEN